ncbi:XrtA system polysaccharide deacetylase [Halovenus rubra]|uniref:XrtA system polysaccharide deacetylase n=2 Tax=Halovenus rubra TaxID=869890 RepID=A0ACC7DVR8_9EURY|nr:XrtA system polysaccharide deacetylase [Halovenus rubra]
MNNLMLSFDVEDWFHSHNLRNGLQRDSWDEYELRVEDSTRRILDLLDKYDTTATFFVLGYVAERTPELVAEIENRGHELASHGYNHELLYEQEPDAVHSDISRSLELLESIVDCPIRGYRAPSFTITDWAIEILDDLGLEYDSSHFPAPVHDRYGDIAIDTSETIVPINQNLTEVQLPLLDMKVTQIPWAGGGYFRFLPYYIYRRGIQRIRQHRDIVFYLHPWELDPDQPRVHDVKRQYQIRHYTNLDRTEKKLERLLSDFNWEPIGDSV